MIWTKRAHQSAKFQTFDCSREISPNLYLNRVLLLKVYKVSAKTVQRIMSHDTEEWCKISKNTNLLFENWQELGELWSKHSKVSKICNLIGPFCAKYITLDLKKYRGVIFNDTEESFKIWRKTDLWFGKWHEEFGKFSPEYLEASKLGLWCGPFVKSRKLMS